MKPSGSGKPSRGSGPGAQPPSPQVPDIILVALGGGRLTRLVCVGRLKALAPNLPVLVIRGQWDANTIAESCGADGYLDKPIAPEELARATSQAAAGHVVLSSEAQAAAVMYLRRLRAARRSRNLSWREREVMRCVAQGMPDKDAATALGIAEVTVHRHQANIYKKLGVHRKDEARRKFAGGGVNSSAPTVL